MIVSIIFSIHFAVPQVGFHHAPRTTAGGISTKLHMQMQKERAQLEDRHNPVLKVNARLMYFRDAHLPSAFFP